MKFKLSNQKEKIFFTLWFISPSIFLSRRSMSSKIALGKSRIFLEEKTVYFNLYLICEIGRLIFGIGRFIFGISTESGFFS